MGSLSRAARPSIGAEFLEAPSSCQCGCGAPAPIAKKSDSRSGAIAGRPRKFRKGHRLRHRLEFADIQAERFWAGVDKGDGSGCWLHRPIQISVGGRRVYSVHVALLLHQGQPVTPEALAKLRIRRRCRRRRCVRPDHVRLGVYQCTPPWRRRADALQALMADLAADGGVQPRKCCATGGNGLINAKTGAK